MILYYFFPFVCTYIPLRIRKFMICEAWMRVICSTWPKAAMRARRRHVRNHHHASASVSRLTVACSERIIQCSVRACCLQLVPVNWGNLVSPVEQTQSLCKLAYGGGRRLELIKIFNMILIIGMGLLPFSRHLIVRWYDIYLVIMGKHTKYFRFVRAEVIKYVAPKASCCMIPLFAYLHPSPSSPTTTSPSSPSSTAYS